MFFDVVAIGELLIDFTPAGISEQGNPLFEANPGGGPPNLLAMLAKLGRKTAFIGKVGNDLHGRFLTRSITSAGIDASGLRHADDKDTTLAFVALDEDGDRDFSFYRKNGADISLRPDEVPLQLLENCRFLHFSSVSMTNEPARSANRHAVEKALVKDILISFDPNLRIPLWESLEEAKSEMLWGISKSTIVKLAKEELEFLTDINDITAGVKKLYNSFERLQLVCVTDGKNGSSAIHRKWSVFKPAHQMENTVDTTGAGDTFFALCLHYLLDNPLASLDEEQAHAMLHQANAAAALITTKRGALLSMPTKVELEDFLSTHPDIHIKD